MKILDCTLRDGGYYNNWDFCPNVVVNYLNSMASAGIDYVELGLRNFPKDGFLGAFAYTTEEYLNSIDLPKGPVYGVMVDAKTILTSGLNVKDSIDDLFVPSVESKIGLIRIAAHFCEVEQSAEIVQYLKQLGYKVGYNLMQAGGKPCDVISSKALMAKEWGALDVLYFADSLGNMDATEVERVITALRVHWDGELGIHTHNNMGKGLDNTLTARNSGVTWLDATITGMGRGAGNTQTESLLAVLDKEGTNYNSKPVYELVVRYFEAMQKELGWGSSLLYFLGAQYEVHPTYIQSLLSNTHFGTDEIVGAIDYLSKHDGTTSYSGDVLDKALSFSSSEKVVSGTKELLDIFSGREILVITNGKTTSKYQHAIEVYIHKKKPVVISVNINETIDKSLIDYYVVSHNMKFLSEFDKYKDLNKPIILPKHRFSDTELENISHLSIVDYGFEVNNNELTAKPTSVAAPYDLTSAYLLGIMIIGKPKVVKLTGFDGYEKGDILQQEMVNLINQYNSLVGTPNLVALTPTSYPIIHGSIYALN